MADNGLIRALLLELRRELSKVQPSRETAQAWEKLDELQQALYRVGVEVRRGDISVFDSDAMREKAKNALLEMGNNARGADAVITHLVNRGVIDLTTWRPEL